MRVLIVSQYFWPESFRINELVRSLVAKGVSVDVLTAKPNYPEGKIYPGYRAIGCDQEKWCGANLFRVPILPRGFRSGVRLFLNYLSFVLSGSIAGSWQLRGIKSDVILVYAPSPLLQALPALLIGRIKRIPVVLWVQDAWPESLEATGYVSNGFAMRAVELMVSFIYRKSNLILISSLPFRDSVERFSPKAEIIYYPNSVDASFCNAEFGLKPEVPALTNGFRVVFAGNVGAAQAVHVIVDAAMRLREHPHIRLIVLGSGSELEWLRDQVITHRLHNLTLAGRFPVEAMPYLLSLADALLVTLADREIFAATVPNKIQAYMAVGKPIIASMNGEGARLVDEAGAGISVPAEDGTALASGILKLYSMTPGGRKRLGENGRQYYLTHFNHEKLADDLVEHLIRATRDKIEDTNPWR